MLINKIKPIIKIPFLALLLLIVSCQSGAAAESSVSVLPQEITVSTGDTFTVDINMDSADKEIYGAQYELYFDSTILNAVSQTQGSFLSQDDATTNVLSNDFNNTIGKIMYGETRMGAPDGVTGSGVLASITFETIKSGTSALTLSYVMLVNPNGDEVVTTVNSGTCVATQPGETPIVSSKATYMDIPIEKANNMIESDPEVFILDVSTRDEYDSEHIIGAEWTQLVNANDISELDKYKDWSIIVYSRNGVKSREACNVLIEHGFENVYNMVGGINAWRVNYPIFTAPKSSPTKIPASLPSDTTIPASSSDNNGIPGFGIVFTMAGLLLVLTLVRKNVEK